MYKQILSEESDNSIIFSIKYNQNSINGVEWNKIVCDLDGNFNHSYEWSRYVSKQFNYSCIYFVLKSSDVIVAAGWYLVNRNAIGPVIICNNVQLETLPCYNVDRISADKVFRELYIFIKKEKFISFHFGNSSKIYIVSNPSDTVFEKINFTINLNNSIDNLYSKLSSDVRRRIRFTEKNNVNVRYFSNEEVINILNELEDMFDFSFSRHVSKGKKRYKHGPASIHDVVNELVITGNAIVFVAFVQDIPISCMIVATFNHKAHCIFSASNLKGYQLKASFKIIWTIIEYFKNNNYPSVSLGEVTKRSENKKDINHGLYKFKLGFGGNTEILVSNEVVLKPLVHKILSTIRRFKFIT